MSGQEAEGTRVSSQQAVAREAVARALAEHSVTFSDEQKAQLADALYSAELALLNAIAKEATRLESFDAARNIPRLVSALQGLRSSMGQGAQAAWAVTAGRAGWFGYTPLSDGDEEYFGEDE